MTGIGERLAIAGMAAMGLAGGLALPSGASAQPYYPPPYYYPTPGEVAAGAAGAAAAAGAAVAAGTAAAAAAAARARDPNWVAYCSRKYRSFDPASGTYMGRDGIRRVCT